VTHFQQTLSSLSKTFTVRDVMVGEKRLVRGHDESEASQLLAKYPDFDVIPIPKSGDITSFLERGADAPKIVTTEDMVSDGTGVFDLVDVIAKRRHVFVLSRQSIAGYVHFSDLNNHLVKIPLFVLLESFESELATAIAPHLSENLLKEQLGESQFGRIKRIADRLRASRANLNWTTGLMFGNIIDLAMHLKLVRLTQADRDKVVSVRNNVDHATGALVESLNDVRDLSEAKRICLQVLQTRTKH